MTSFLSDKLNLTNNAKVVLERRYLKKDQNGNVSETPEEMFWRVASTIAQADHNERKDNQHIKWLSQEFYKLFADKSFMPNSPTLMNAGRELGQLSACFVLPVDDSLEDIFETIKNTALIHKSGGGTGFSFSRLRPKNDIVRSTMGVSSGPVSFIEVFNAATEAVKQGGTRRGANMAILRVDHPDIIDFINAKFDTDKLTNFNISVGITDEFMEAVKSDSEFNLVHPRTKETAKTVNAKEIFDLIVDHAWRNGEPGIVFIDEINKYNPTPKIGEIESTNPCGEVPLLPYEACNLGSVNLAQMIKYDEDKPEVDWDKLEYVTKLSIHFLDNVIALNKFPLPKIEEMARKNRKIGLGIMGWADMLMTLNIPYNSEEGLTLASQIMEFIDYHSKVKSVELAQVRGKFENFNGSVYDNNMFLFNKYKGRSAGTITDEDWHNLDIKIQTNGIRNATTTCIAPTGTISMIAGASGGIEPLFSLVFIRKIMDNTELMEVNPIFENKVKEEDLYSEELMKIIAREGTVQNIKNLPDDIKKVFVTAHDISPEWHVKMQAAFQLHTDNAVSKTVNFEEDATREAIKETYYLAYEKNLKGITVYRNNSRIQPMNLDTSKDSKKEEENKSKESKSDNNAENKAENNDKNKTVVCCLEKNSKIVTPRERPNVTFGITDKIQTGCGPLYITINSDEEGLCEVFARMGKSGGCATSQAEATGRMISLALRAGVNIHSIINQLKGIRCPAPSIIKGDITLSCSDAISKVLERNAEKAQKMIYGESFEYVECCGEYSDKEITTSIADLGLCPECPECGEMIEFSEGCILCKSCGYSRCN